MRGRQIVRKYLTSSPFKPLVKTTRYKQPRYAAQTSLKTPSIRDAEVAGAIKIECEVLCKKVRSSSVDSLALFKFSDIIEELKEKTTISVTGCS